MAFEAVQLSEPGRLRRLLKQSSSLAEESDSQGFNLLHLAASYEVDCVKTLLTAGSSVQTRNKSGMTPLHCALGDHSATGATKDVVDTLLQVSMHQLAASGL
jgi:ankyrin repeat protein